MLATMFATDESVRAAISDQRPPDKRPDFPHCCANDLRARKATKRR